MNIMYKEHINLFILTIKQTQKRLVFNKHLDVGMIWLSSQVRLFETRWAIQSMEFSRPEYWSGLLSLSLGDLPDSGVDPRSPALQEIPLPVEPWRKPKNTGVGSLSLLQGSSQPRNRTSVSCIAGRFFTTWATWEPHLMHKEHISIFILIIKKPHKRLVFSKQLDIRMIGLSSQVSKWLSCVRLFVTSWTVVHGILQTRILEWVALPFSSRSSWPRNQSLMGFPHISVGKEFACHEGDPSLIPGSGRCLGDGIGYPL